MVLSPTFEGTFTHNPEGNLMNVNPTPDVVESKLVAASIITLLAGIAVALLNAVQADSSILGSLPPAVQFVILAAIPPVLSFAAGYVQHSNRV